MRLVALRVLSANSECSAVVDFSVRVMSSRLLERIYKNGWQSRVWTGCPSAAKAERNFVESDFTE